MALLWEFIMNARVLKITSSILSCLLSASVQFYVALVHRMLEWEVHAWQFLPESNFMEVVPTYVLVAWGGSEYFIGIQANHLPSIVIPISQVR